jgi:hypothetical protein
MHGVYNMASTLASTSPVPQSHLFVTPSVLTNEGQGNKKGCCNHSIKDAWRYNLKLVWWLFKGKPFHKAPYLLRNNQSARQHCPHVYEEYIEVFLQKKKIGNYNHTDRNEGELTC